MAGEGAFVAFTLTMSDGNRVIRRLYLYHAVNNIALSVVTNFLFLDKLFLRMGLDFASFGVIKGISFLIPMLVNLLLSPFIQAVNKDRELVALTFGIRVFLPLLLLLVPRLHLQGAALVALITCMLVVIHMFPIVANNCLQNIIRSTIPEQSLGKHLTWINVVWTLPGYMLAIPLSRYVDRFSGASDELFYGALFTVMLGTAVFQLIASPLMLTLPKPPERVAPSRKQSLLRSVSAPFKDPAYRPLLMVVLVFTTLSAMIASFINPYLLLVRQLNLGQISMISAGVSLLSIVAMPIWGRLLDSLGGQNSYRIALVGFIVGMAVLLGAGWTSIVVFALFSYEGQRGAFGSGLAISQQYLIMVKADSSQRSIYYAAATSMIGVGWFIGANVGGILLQLLLNLGGGRFSLSAAYNMMFLLCIALALLLMLLIRKIPQDRASLPGKYLWIHIYKSITKRGKLKY
jgi:predicted MFS family arabinose efflux permease